eukprot:TRINITY_DN20112_c0_g1_i1.p1 TRINITY_DN20112_c0_g1~~TRINITY_DN20112_c0_g1_i1.p1  ORF type:complete len:296 (+),score=102.19 TRINITY_DN20112_c0_g1_i1:56-943(+)
MPKMAFDDAMWLHRAGCLLVVVLTYVFALSEANRLTLTDSVRWHSSPIDWCEENYETHDLVAEFWNMLSGVIIFPCTGAAWFLHGSVRRLVEPRFAFCLITLTLVGVGSIYFHATLSTLGQVLDEITICWTNYYAILLVMPRSVFERRFGSTARRLIVSPETLVTVIAVTPVWAIFSPIISHVLTVLTIVLLPWAIIEQFRTQKTTAASQRILRLALAAHGTAVFSWVIDRLLCHQITHALGFYPQLHAFWHMFVFIGAYFTIVGITWVRSIGDGFNATIEHYKDLLPYTKVEKL